jgi:hypothetical protein
VILAPEEELATLTIAITSLASWGSQPTRAGELRRAINFRCSRQQARKRKKALERAGQRTLFSAAECPYCESVVDLSGFARTPQMYCPFCEVVVTRTEAVPPGEHGYRLCDTCGYYGRQRPFTDVFVVFLVVAAMHQHQTTVMCHACMRPAAWKMLWKNLIFLLGVPIALSQLVRAYTAPVVLCRAYPGLDAANYAAHTGNFAKADDLYRRILDRAGPAAGVHYNRAVLLAGAGQWEECLEEIEAAWADCANYRPAFQLACTALQNLGRDAEAAALSGRLQPEPRPEGAPTAGGHGEAAAAQE